MTIQDNDQREKDRQLAQKRLQAGLKAYQADQLDQAIEAFGDAETRFRLIGDFKQAGDCRALIADVQRQNAAFEQAINSYQRAIKLYRDASRPLLEANCTLSVGHIERQLAHLDRAQDAYQQAQHLYRIHQNEQGLGNTALALGHIELQRGNTQYAADHYQDAIDHFKKANDSINEADASRSLADIQRISRNFTAAISGYQHALTIYQATRDIFGVIDAQIGLARIYLEQERLDEATQLFADTLRTAQTAEYELGQADANLGLAEILFLQGQIDQALIEAQTALQSYTDQHNALGVAQASHLLGEIHLRRGQLSYANSLVERATRTYQAIAVRIGLAEATVSLGDLQLRRGLLDRAIQTFHESRNLAHKLNNVQVESRALLGLGNVFSRQGQHGQARSAYDHARERGITLGTKTAAELLAQVEVYLARLAIFSGDMQEAEARIAAAQAAILHNPLAEQVAPLIALAQGQLALTIGTFPVAEQYFYQAHAQAEQYQEPFLAAEALVGLAQIQLASLQLETALNMFLMAGRAYQLIESTDGDGYATLGVAQVNIGQQNWTEAIEYCDAALVRLTQTGDVAGQADTLLTRGLAHRGKDEIDEALQDFEQALKFYHQTRRPLGVADTRSARGSIFLLRGDLERAKDEQSKAITQVENVLHSISSTTQWPHFLRQYAELYAQAAITDIQRGQFEQARTLLQSFVGIAGKTELLQQIKHYLQDLPTTDTDLPEDELRANKELLKRIEQLTKGL